GGAVERRAAVVKRSVRLAGLGQTGERAAAIRAATAALRAEIVENLVFPILTRRAELEDDARIVRAATLGRAVKISVGIDDQLSAGDLSVRAVGLGAEAVERLVLPLRPVWNDFKNRAGGILAA